MARYAIWAADQIYGGLHGMYSCGVYECDSYEEACDIGKENSYDIMGSYSCIEDELEEGVRSEMESSELNEDEDADYYCEEEYIRTEIYADNVEYTVRKIDEVAAACYATKDLDIMYAKDPDGFVEEYCVK